MQAIRFKISFKLPKYKIALLRYKINGESGIEQSAGADLLAVTLLKICDAN
jgi:hypothetical protein